MPHTTYAYPFERKVRDFAQRYSCQLAGDEHHTFLMLFDPPGVVRTLYFKCPDNSWHILMERLDKDESSYLFFDPFDAPECVWLSWRQIDRPTMERLIGSHFKDADFEKGLYGASQAPDLQPPNEFPASWEVMF
jgi:hypothetical protein